MFSKLANSMARFKLLTEEVFRVHPGVQRLRRVKQTNAANFRKKGLSAKGRRLYTEFMNR